MKKTKKILTILLVVIFILSFSSVALAAGNADNPGQGAGSEKEKPNNSNEIKKNEFTAAIKAELAELRQLRTQLRESHKANLQLRQQIQERKEELLLENPDLNEEQLERLRNAIQTLRQEAIKNQNCVDGFSGNISDWNKNKKELDVERALANLNALQDRYRNMLASQERIADCLSVVLAHLQTV